LMDSLHVPGAHLLGWSAGAGVAMQLALDHSLMVKSLTLVAPISPFGFGGTCDINGTPNSSDFAGCGAGTVSPDAVEQMRLGNSSLSSDMAPRQLLRNYFVNSLKHHPREDLLVDAMLKQKLGDQRYPGDYVKSPNPPYMGPGRWGPINALSPKFFNASGLADLRDKPPILWLRGAADCIISDASLFDMATVLRDSALAENDPETARTFRPQPMVAQMHQLLERYKQNHGSYKEIVLADAGHTPFIEEQEVFLKQFTSFLSSV
jgi:pimeloyl-ACP methyl ester carboxylesterase